MKELKVIFAAIATLVLTSCVGFPSLAPRPSATPSGPRTIILDGEAVTEEEVGGFTCWYCQDFIDGGRTLVEVGFFGYPIYEGLGFVLYDGGYSGERTHYFREGMEHRWDWGPNGTDYAFVIEPDGTGAYYDFSSGSRTKASAIYQCHRR